ncbi:MAG: 3-deoxy-7-phosphoheptulonate synthase [Chloroflexi bacterium]|nr:3-deoxy-7-phosphoheptulonate synthase [Chloroflexota bacterium]
MVIVMKKGATEAQIASVIQRVEDLGYQAHLSRGEERTIIGIIGNDRPLVDHPLARLDGVESIVPILHPFKLASRDFHPEDSVVSIDSVAVGGERVIVMAGPCAVESREQLWEAAVVVKESGAAVLRGGAFKPRSSPYSFHGLGQEGLELLAEVRLALGLPVVTEVMSPAEVALTIRHADILQIGTRNMQNYALLQEVGRSGHPVLLKRGMMSTIEELLLSAEYILAQGNHKVILCERGIRTFDVKYTRNTLDIAAIPVIKKLSHLPVVVDPSHGTGNWEYVGAASRAAVAAGADGLLIEVHPHPEKALSDGAQSLRPEAFAQLMVELRLVAQAVGRTL